MPDEERSTVARRGNVILYGGMSMARRTFYPKESLFDQMGAQAQGAILDWKKRRGCVGAGSQRGELKRRAPGAAQVSQFSVLFVSKSNTEGKARYCVRC